MKTIENHVPAANTLEAIDAISLMRVNRQPMAGKINMEEFHGHKKSIEDIIIVFPRNEWKI